MTTYELKSKDSTKVKNLLELVEKDLEAKTTLVVFNDAGEEVNRREFEKIDATDSIMNNWSYQSRGKAGWIDAREPSDPNAPKKERKASGGTKASPFKVAAKFNLETGVAEVTLGEHGDVMFTAEDHTWHIPDHVLSARSSKLAELAGEGSKKLASATEVGPDGKLIVAGWSLGSYSSTKDTVAEAASEILIAAFMAKDVPFVTANNVALMTNPESVLVKTGAGTKGEWLAKWLPAPVEVVTPATKPSEEPSKVNVKTADAGLKV